MSNIILASSSPRRKELLERRGLNFRVEAPLIDEILDETLPIDKRIEKLALDKATKIHKDYNSDVVIAGDTVVCLDSQIIGKPKDEQDARQILSQLSGKRHMVYTGVAIYCQDDCIHFVDGTAVYFKTLDEKMINEYIKTGEWQGKAGAYAIQGVASQFVERIDGNIDTVIGLPVDLVIGVLKDKKII